MAITMLTSRFESSAVLKQKWQPDRKTTISGVPFLAHHRAPALSGFICQLVILDGAVGLSDAMNGQRF
jgi:hypothetical protein